MTINSAPPALQPLLDRLEAAATAEAVRFAVEDLAAANLPEAVPMLIHVLGYNNPGAAVAAVEGLIAIGEPAVMPLIALLDGFNYGARAWALRALAGIGDPRGIDLLTQAAVEDFALSVRRAAARGLGKLQWQGFASGDRFPAQHKALATLLQVCEDPEWVVRYAAVTGLEALGLAWEASSDGTEAEDGAANNAANNKADATGRAGGRSQLQARLNSLAQTDESTALRARATLALQRLEHSAQQ
ncbi:MAG: HEAT repeat domain-containing protein [Synechococcales cyanobacterium RM1_1_8]|nr:HEAT repeat domain-containing protein [Synechococcales cyanobacterium RM1_1_8]